MKNLIYLYLIVMIVSCANKVDSVSADEVNGNINHLFVDGKYLKTPCNEKVILRGINEMFIWSSDRVGVKMLPEIAKTGANCVRLVWTTKGSANELDQLIANSIANNMIPIAELHDATGKIEGVSNIVDYWTSDTVTAVLKKHEPYLLLNIANEAGDHSVTDSLFVAIYKSAVSRIRETGLKSPIMIDAAGWGQNIDILQSTWKELQAHDDIHNLLFSVHTWWPRDSTSEDPGAVNRILTEIKETVASGMPLVIGEFAPMGPGCKQYFDYEVLIEQCQKNEIGWLSWSWGLANNGDCADMDMTEDGVFGNWMTTSQNGKWGEIVSLSSQYSIRNTSVISRYVKDDFRCKQ